MNILDFTLEELKLWMVENNESGFRAKQVFDWIYKGVFEFELMKNLPQNTKNTLIDNFEIDVPVILQTLISEKDGTRKYLLKYKDGNIIEAVIMRYTYGNSICISTQIGCRMGCTFCASTIEGRDRDLSSGEMLAEVLVLQKDLEDRISNIVLMGSGEPLDNYLNVIKFIKTSNDKYGLNIGQRHITLSTCGIVPKIYELAEEDLQITLAISLHAPNDFIRQQSMPIAKRYSMDELINACKYYIKKTNRRITFEYALIKDFNDGIDNAKKLSDLLRGLLCHVNLIPLNEVVERDYKKTDKRNIEDFQKILIRNGIEVTLRREMGADINAACGQLRRSYIKDSKLS